MKISCLYVLVFLSLILTISSCKDDDPTITIDNPVMYDFSRNGESTVSFSGQTTRIGMASELGDNLTTFDITEETLLEMYSNMTTSGQDANPYADESLNESTKSVKSKIAASKDFFSANTAESAIIKTQFETWISAQVNEVFPTINMLASAGNAGQVADGSSVRYVNAKGLEYNQAIIKSIIGALMLDQINNNYLSTAILDEGSNKDENDGEITSEGNPYTTMEHKWDEAYGYLFGASANPMDPLSTLGEGNFLNKYLARVNNDADFADYADNIWNAFKLGRAAIVARDYETRDEQADILRTMLSEVVAIRAVYYLQQGKRAIEANPGNPSAAFHDLSEGYGFIYSLRFTRQNDQVASYFSSNEIQEYLEILDSGNGFWDVSPDDLQNISEEIAAKFDFTVAQAAE